MLEGYSFIEQAFRADVLKSEAREMRLVHYIHLFAFVKANVVIYFNVSLSCCNCPDSLKLSFINVSR